MEDELYTDVAAQRCHAVMNMAAYIDTVTNPKARRIMLEMMQSLTDTIIKPKVETKPKLAFNGRPINDD